MKKAIHTIRPIIQFAQKNMMYIFFFVLPMIIWHVPSFDRMEETHGFYMPMEYCAGTVSLWEQKLTALIVWHSSLASMLSPPHIYPRMWRISTEHDYCAGEVCRRVSTFDIGCSIGCSGSPVFARDKNGSRKLLGLIVGGNRNFSHFQSLDFALTELRESLEKGRQLRQKGIKPRLQTKNEGIKVVNRVSDLPSRSFRGRGTAASHTLRHRN